MAKTAAQIAIDMVEAGEEFTSYWTLKLLKPIKEASDRGEPVDDCDVAQLLASYTNDADRFGPKGDTA
jgi:hypothetical protein